MGDTVAHGQTHYIHHIAPHSCNFGVAVQPTRSQLMPGSSHLGQLAARRSRSARRGPAGDQSLTSTSPMTKQSLVSASLVLRPNWLKNLSQDIPYTQAHLQPSSGNHTETQLQRHSNLPFGTRLWLRSSHGSLKRGAKSKLMSCSPFPALSGVGKSNPSARDSTLPTHGSSAISPHPIRELIQKNESQLLQLYCNSWCEPFQQHSATWRLLFPKAHTQNPREARAPVLLGTTHAHSKQAPTFLLVTQIAIQQFLHILM